MKKLNKISIRQIIIPPLESRNKILNLYYKDLKEIDNIHALIKYKQLMHELYKRYNPWMRPVIVNENNWFKY